MLTRVNDVNFVLFLPKMHNAIMRRHHESQIKDIQQNNSPVRFKKKSKIGKTEKKN